MKRTPTLQEAFTRFQTDYMPGKFRSPHTRAAYASDIAHWLEEVTITDPRQLDTALIHAYISQVARRGVSSATLHRNVAGLKAFFLYLEKTLKVLPKGFSDEITLPRVERPDPRFLTPEQYTALLREAATNPRDYAILEVLLQTGIRLSELTALTLSDIDLPQKPSQKSANGYGLMRVKRKRGKTQELILNYKACRALQAYLKTRPKNSDPHVFLSKYGEPLTNRSVQKMFKKYAQAAGISWAHVHTLRTTHITEHLSRGTDIATVKENAGHDSIATTNYYAGLVKERMIRAMQQNAL